MHLTHMGGIGDRKGLGEVWTHQAPPDSRSTEHTSHNRGEEGEEPKGQLQQQRGQEARRLPRQQTGQSM